MCLVYLVYIHSQHNLKREEKLNQFTVRSFNATFFWNVVKINLIWNFHFAKKKRTAPTNQINFSEICRYAQSICEWICERKNSHIHTHNKIYNYICGQTHPSFTIYSCACSNPSNKIHFTQNIRGNKRAGVRNRERERENV